MVKKTNLNVLPLSIFNSFIFCGSIGKIDSNDHCRVCHKIGFLLCCDTCPAVYHLDCLDPPLDETPEDDWQCPLCTAQFCKGVGKAERQDCLGIDRHGRKYWFISRRIFVEKEMAEEQEENLGKVASGSKGRQRKTWYFSTPSQFEQLIASLDRVQYEKSLCRKLESLRDTILEQMEITSTKDLKGTLWYLFIVIEAQF